MLADRDDEVTYAAARSAADAAVRAADPDLSPEAAADAIAEAVAPFFPSEKNKTGNRRKIKIAPAARGGAAGGAAEEGDHDDDLDEDDAFEETMLLGHGVMDQHDDGGGNNVGGSGPGRGAGPGEEGDAVARSQVSEGLATAALLRYARTRGLRERILHARNYAASVRSRLAADRRYHESAAYAALVSPAYNRAPPTSAPDVDAYEEDSEVGVRVRGPSGHLVLYPAAVTEMSKLEQEMLSLGTRCLHHRAFAMREAATVAAAAAATPSLNEESERSSSFNLDDDEDDGAVGVDRAALLEDLFEAEARWQSALRALTAAYLSAAESAADPGDREALRTAAANATFRRPRLHERGSSSSSSSSSGGGAGETSPAGAYAAAVAAVELEAELVTDVLAHQRDAENASRALCELSLIHI